MGVAPATTAYLHTIILLVGMVLLIIGALAWRRGRWPKRIGDTPHCPRCEYSLAGLQDPDRCPECGTDVSYGRCVRGERRRRPGLAMLGQLVLVIGLGGVLVALTGALNRVDWYRHRPTAWVIKDLAGTGGQPA